MSYTALYRKFRPASFSEVKGQDHIVRTLKNQVASGRAGHAYLFCGTRGTGKTSVAKVLAKAVNCESPVDGNPCNTCAMCREIAAGASMNVIEIDAASNNGVDNIRQVIEEVAYPPAKGRYKVYIIDEVHMLSTGAFNALLKTLEEPPSYVIFILATTEAHKVPITIMSRCQRYDFRRISSKEIAAHLKELAGYEKLLFEEKALDFIARQADGSMRDALSLLDKCIAFNFGDTLTYDKVLEVLGTADTGVFYALADAIYRADAAKALAIIDETASNGKELTSFIPDFIWHLRNLLLTKISDDIQEILGVSEEDFREIKKQSEEMEAPFLIHCINTLSELSSVLRTTTQKRIMTEVYMIRLCRPAMGEDTGSLEERIRHLEQRLEGASLQYGIVPAREKENAEVPETKEVGNSRIQKAEPSQAPDHIEISTAVIPDEGKADTNVKDEEDISVIIHEWGKILSSFKGMEKSMLEEAKISADDEKNVRLTYAKTAEFTYSYVSQSNLTDKLTEIVKKKYGKEIHFRAVLSEKNNMENENNIEKLRSIVTIPVEEE